MQKKTLVVGASSKPERYSNKAIRMLLENAYPVVAVGARNDKVGPVAIEKGTPDFDDIHTVTMYLGPRNQMNMYDYILNLNPKRIIFNPGTENAEFINMAKNNGIEVEQACTLVLLSTDQF